MFQVDWSLTFAVLAVLSMTLGNFAALTSRSITRILAYSSIGQAGYILVGFAAGGAAGLTGSFFHILNYAIMQSGAFLAAAVIIRALGSDDLDAFDGVGKRMTVAPLAPVGQGIQAVILLNGVSHHRDSSLLEALLDQMPALPFAIHDNMRSPPIEEIGNVPHAPVEQ